MINTKELYLNNDLAGFKPLNVSHELSSLKDLNGNAVVFIVVSFYNDKACKAGEKECHLFFVLDLKTLKIIYYESFLKISLDTIMSIIHKITEVQINGIVKIAGLVNPIVVVMKANPFCSKGFLNYLDFLGIKYLLYKRIDELKEFYYLRKNFKKLILKHNDLNLAVNEWNIIINK